MHSKLEDICIFLLVASLINVIYNVENILSKKRDKKNYYRKSKKFYFKFFEN